MIATGAVGLHLPRKVYFEKELTFLNSRSYGTGRYDPRYEEKGQDYPLGYVRWTEGRNLEAVVDLLGTGRLDVKPLISHRFSLNAAPSAYELITGKKKEPFLGVLLTYTTPEPAEPLSRLEKIPTPGAANQPAEQSAWACWAQAISPAPSCCPPLKRPPASAWWASVQDPG